MTRRIGGCSYVVALVLVVASTSGAQEMRRRPQGGDATAAESGAPRDAQNPFVGLWRGVRTLPAGRDDLGLRFTAVDGKYVGYMIVGDGQRILSQNLTYKARSLEWESPNSGGGTWVYSVHLAAPDSLVGTLVLRDAPPAFPDVPRGTLTLKRVPAAADRK